MIRSFLLIGQSNMAGRGALSEALPVDGSQIRVLRCGRWQKFFRPVNPDRSFSGVCLAESFAEAYAARHGVTAGLTAGEDSLHFDSPSLHQFGLRYFSALETL